MGPKAVAHVLLLLGIGLCGAQEASDAPSSGEVVEATEDVLHSGSATWALAF